MQLILLSVIAVPCFPFDSINCVVFDQCYTAGNVLAAYCTDVGLLFVLQFS